jgi:hypothetical protein
MTEGSAPIGATLSLRSIPGSRFTEIAGEPLGGGKLGQFYDVFVACFPLLVCVSKRFSG